MYPAGVAGVVQRYITLASGLKVRIVESGPADGPPVVLFSGWGGNVYMYRKNVPVLAEAGLRVIAVDLKGQGLSDKPSDPEEYTGEEMTAHALQILDALGLDRVRLVGQSMAGKIAANTAIAAPERIERLVLIGAVGVGKVLRLNRLGMLPLRTLDLIEPVTARWTFWAVLHRAYGKLARPTDRDVEEYYAATADPNFIRALFLLLRKFDWGLLTPEELARLTMPVLIVAGTEDHVIDPNRVERVAARLKDVRTLVVPGAGHVPNEEAADVVNQALVEFLAP
jgi:pimeloyl-ACP methyl ester carboxylesterase